MAVPVVPHSNILLSLRTITSWALSKTPVGLTKRIPSVSSVGSNAPGWAKVYVPKKAKATSENKNFVILKEIKYSYKYTLQFFLPRCNSFAFVIFVRKYECPLLQFHK